MQQADAPIHIVKSKGLYLYDEAGKSYQDWISSWWVNIHGHAHPALADALYAQAQALEQVIFTRFTHAPAEQLAAQITARLPKNLHKVFYSDNGSTAIEVAVKMAYQYFQNQGKLDKKLFYH
jgi:adenosylmethionine-8-amino-7-oxononanoate aminotransferase